MTGSSAARILVVDDDDDNRYTLCERLRRLGYVRLRTAVDGHDAIARMREAPVDLVLLDVMMPRLDGVETLARIKADAALRHVPVVMVSSLDQTESAIRCIELGAEDYLHKPFDATLLRARVGASLQRKRLQDEIAAALARLERELGIARGIQLAMMPPALPPPTPARPVEVAATLLPARQVGGDFYDFFYCGERTLCLLVADVCDKGVPAALVMALAKSLIRLVAALPHPEVGTAELPARVLARVNDEFCRERRDDMFVTAFLGCLDLDARRFSYCNAGHVPSYRLRAGGGVAPLDAARSFALGLSPHAAFGAATVDLDPGDGLFLCTDGVTEAADAAGGLYGEHRLEAILRSAGGRTASETVEAVVADARAFRGGAEQSDDIAAVAARLVAH